MAGVALGDIHLRFAWLAWHLGHWAGSGGALFARWVAQGAVPLCMGVALGDIHLGFAWQVWHLVTSTLVSRRRHDSRRSLAERQDRTSWQLFANNVGKNGYGISHPRLQCTTNGSEPGHSCQELTQYQTWLCTTDSCVTCLVNTLDCPDLF